MQRRRQCRPVQQFPMQGSGCSTWASWDAWRRRGRQGWATSSPFRHQVLTKTNQNYSSQSWPPITSGEPALSSNLKSRLTSIESSMNLWEAWQNPGHRIVLLLYIRDRTSKLNTSNKQKSQKINATDISDIIAYPRPLTSLLYFLAALAALYLPLVTQ